MADLRQSILDTEDIESELVDVEQWGVKILIKSPTARARARLMRQFISNDTGEIDYEAMYPALVIATAHDPETGEMLFEPTDADLLNQKNGAALETLAKPALRLAGFVPDEVVDEGKADSD